jgi:hypothetical protein
VIADDKLVGPEHPTMKKMATQASKRSLRRIWAGLPTIALHTNQLELQGVVDESIVDSY